MNSELAESYFTDLFENTSDLIHYVSLEGSIEKVNPAWLSTLGYKFEEVQGRSIYDLIDPNERSAFKAYRETTTNGGRHDNIQVTFISKNGMPVILQGHLRVFSAYGSLKHTRGVFRNVTSRILAEKLQQEQLLKITQFLSNAPDAVVIIDETQHIIEWNLKASEIFGYSPQEVMNKPLAEFIIPMQFREAHHNGMAHFLRTGHGPVLNKTIEVPAIDKNQREFPISLSISAAMIDDKWFFIAFISDITDRKQNERALIEKEIELERSQLDSYKNQEFLSIASHEIRTPLTSLKAYLQLALRSAERGPMKQTVAFLHKADDVSNKLAKLIMNLLDISKIHSGKLTIQKEQVELTAMIQETIEANQLLYASHKLDFSFSEFITIEIDKERIEQVFSNLISNAVKYSPTADKVKLSVERKKSHVQIAVKDYGSGIDVDSRDKVFEKFYRIEDLSTKHTSGLGIGLFISSEIIKQHEGTIWVENNPDGGATFFVTLPLNS